MMGRARPRYRSDLRIVPPSVETIGGSVPHRSVGTVQCVLKLAVGHCNLPVAACRGRCDPGLHGQVRAVAGLRLVVLVIQGHRNRVVFSGLLL